MRPQISKCGRCAEFSHPASPAERGERGGGWVQAAGGTGRSTNQIAQAPGISPLTIQDHLKAVFTKVRVRSRAELVARPNLLHYAAAS